jgi:hypothetical protein
MGLRVADLRGLLVTSCTNQICNRTRIEKVAVLEMQLDGPCLEAGPGSLSEMHLTRVVSLESLLQILHFIPWQMHRKPKLCASACLAAKS